MLKSNQGPLIAERQVILVAILSTIQIEFTVHVFMKIIFFSYDINVEEDFYLVAVV